MSFNDLERDQSAAGELLRSEAANLLSERYGEPKVEKRQSGKKVDIYFEYRRLGKTHRIYVESKDYSKPLHRSDVVNIWSDYSGIVSKNAPAELLIVTRCGLSPDARSYVDDEIAAYFHQTIRELEDEVFQIIPYTRQLSTLLSEDGLENYYIETHAFEPSTEDNRFVLHEKIHSWLESPSSRPIAILGGYGVGKTSFAKRLVSLQAQSALADPNARRPILIRLGEVHRATSLKSLMGGMFTDEYRLDGYTYSSFMNLNQKGRFLIVLDGFDEMKHAMTWADFRSTFKDLNQLNSGSSKVILIGRPSAFLSDDEHVYVIRGIERRGSHEIKVHGWPEHIEYRISPFTTTESQNFVASFLRYSENTNAVRDGRQPNLNWVNSRTKELQELIKSDQDLLTRPVHARILVEMGADPAVSLSAFKTRVSQWALYELFFDHLGQREVEKPARRPITEQPRLQFLMDLALWLWNSKAGATSFHAGEIPRPLIDLLPGEASMDVTTKLREYLTAAFLDRKMGDVYYFPHRSFAEFLVAYGMYRQPPSGFKHGTYSDLFVDGVKEFLLQVPDRARIGDWLRTFCDSRVLVQFSYVKFLTECFIENGGDTAELRSSAWYPVVAYIEADETDRRSVLLDLLRNAIGPQIALAMKMLTVHASEIDPEDGNASTIIVEAIGILVERIFGLANDCTQRNRIVVNGEGAAIIKRLLAGGVQFTRDSTGDKFVFVDLASMVISANGILSEFSMNLKLPDEALTLTGTITFDQEALLFMLSPGVAKNFSVFFKHATGFSSISVETKDRIQPRRRK